MDNFTYIDNYFKGVALQDQEIKFEERLLIDKEFAEDVAFYLNTIQVARGQNEQEKKKRFVELFKEDRSHLSVSPVRKLRPYVAAAAAVLAALFFGLYLYMQPASPPKLAGQYLTEHFPQMVVQMGSNTSSMQTARDMYNDKNYSGSLQTFEQVIRDDSANYTARELAGIVALQLNQFDKALRYFGEVADNKDLDENSGKFYQALTYMKRNLADDKDKAKVLLQEVVKDALFGKEDAVKFLNDL